jgi:3-deoxy-D-manno-octulosonate 8-phosphate phosphatase (KDO 8-P phosphatase)
MDRPLMIRRPRSNAKISAMPKLSAQARARKIKLLLFDVDGVLTDGKLFFLPEGYPGSPSSQHTARGQIEFKGFHAHDGTSISLARLGGIKTGLITKRISETVALRARDLKLDFIHQGVDDKRTCFEEVVARAGLKLDEAAFVGDDVIDIPAMRAGGLAVAVKNARDDVKKQAHYVTPHSGGDGALRDAVEFILKAQGKWKRVIADYIGEKSPRGKS